MHRFSIYVNFDGILKSFRYRAEAAKAKNNHFGRINIYTRHIQFHNYHNIIINILLFNVDAKNKVKNYNKKE